MTADSTRKAYYHFRYGANRPDAVELAKAMDADEIALFLPNAEETCDGPSTDQQIEAGALEAQKHFDAARRAGITPSVNIFWTVGFSDFPQARRSARERFDFRWAVNIDGVESQVIACPNDEKWRGHMARMYRRYALLRPAVLWIDDDVRLTMRADVQGPCFCNHCMDDMAQRTGRKWERKELVRAIVADPPVGGVNPVRQAWLAFQRQTLDSLIRRLSGAVHEVSPSTRVGLMFSPPEYHAPEGRRWHGYLEAAGPGAIGRPGVGCYNEGNAFQIAQGLGWARQVQALAPEGQPLAPEIEGYPYSPMSKSYALDKAQMTVCQVLGMNQVTINILPFAAGGSELIANDACAQMRSIKPRLSALAALAPRPEDQQGVRVFVHEEISPHVRGAADAPKPVFLFRKRPWETSLPLLGVPTTFHTSAVTAIAGEEIDCLDERQIESLFSGGVLMDARAGEAMIRRGLGRLIGAEHRLDNAVHCKETPVGPGAPINTRFDGEAWQFKWDKAVTIHSEFRDYNHWVTGTGVASYENSLGGRVVVMPFDSQSGAVVFGIPGNALASPGFVSPARQTQLQPLIRWLFKSSACPAFFTGHRPVYPLVVGLSDGSALASLTNLGADAVDGLGWVTQLAAGRAVRWLDDAGAWHGLDDRGRVALSTIPALGTAAVVIS